MSNVGVCLNRASINGRKRTCSPAIIGYATPGTKHTTHHQAATKLGIKTYPPQKLAWAQRQD